jgi:putative DNA-invertase from lambdoid prophage Rac
MTAAIYARVSTYDQNCDMQLTELRGYAARMGWQAPIEYVETASGRRGSKRAVQEQLIADARLRKFDVVLVWKLDRLGRSLLDLISHVQTFDSLGIRFIATTQGIDTDKQNPMSRLLLHLMGAFAEFERSVIVERVQAGATQYKADYAAGRIGKDKHSKSGKDLPSGRPRVIFRRDEAEKLRKLGHSWRAIAKHMNISATTIRDALSAPKSLKKGVRKV